MSDPRQVNWFHIGVATLFVLGWAYALWHFAH